MSVNLLCMCTSTGKVWQVSLSAVISVKTVCCWALEKAHSPSSHARLPLLEIPTLLALTQSVPITPAWISDPVHIHVHVYVYCTLTCTCSRNVLVSYPLNIRFIRNSKLQAVHLALSCFSVHCTCTCTCTCTCCSISFHFYACFARSILELFCGVWQALSCE